MHFPFRLLNGECLRIVVEESGAILRIKSTSAHPARTGSLCMTSTLASQDRATNRPGSLPDTLPDNAGRAAMGIAIVLTAQLMFILDATVVNVALPKIDAALGFGPASISWV